MEGNPLGKNRQPSEEIPPTLINPDERVTEYAVDYEAKLKEQADIMLDAQSLMMRIEHDKTLNPDAVSKVLNDQTLRYMKAKTRLAELQAENAEKIKPKLQ